MYNSVWLEEREMHLHRFLWRDDHSEEMGEYAITRVNIGEMLCSRVHCTVSHARNCKT